MYDTRVCTQAILIGSVAAVIVVAVAVVAVVILHIIVNFILHNKTAVLSLLLLVS